MEETLSLVGKYPEKHSWSRAVSVEIFLGWFPSLGQLRSAVLLPLLHWLNAHGPLHPALTPHQNEYPYVRTGTSNFLGPKNSPVLTTYQEEHPRAYKGTEQTHSPTNPPNSELKRPLSSGSAPSPAQLSVNTETHFSWPGITQITSIRRNTTSQGRRTWERVTNTRGWTHVRKHL